MTSKYPSFRGDAFDVKGDDEDLYSGFNDVAPALDTRKLREDEAFQEALRTSAMGKRGLSRMGTAANAHRSLSPCVPLLKQFRGGTASIRLATGARTGAATTAAGGAARPMTAVRAAGYTSTARPTTSQYDRKEETMEDKIRHMERRIMTLIEESCALSVQDSGDGDLASRSSGSPTQKLGEALSKAQEASTLERQLIRMQEQASLGDQHNLDLTFAVLCNLAGQYALNEMYTEALNTYQLLTRNKLFPHANRLKVNMGNIYFKMGEHPKALKLYRMALDQTPTAEKDLRMKVMHNIGLLLVRMGKFRDAVENFQHIMHEQGDFQTGLHLVLCSVALNDVEGGKGAFHAMLDVEPPAYHQDIVLDDESDAYEAVLRDVVRGDRLARWSRREAARAERCLVLAAAALAPLVQPTTQSGQDRRLDDVGIWWCVEALRGWEAGGAGARLELGAALAALRAGGSAGGARVAQRLKAVARAHQRDRLVRAEANADAAFVAYALGNYAEAQTLGVSAARDDPYGAAARVTAALASAAAGGDGWAPAAEQLAAAVHLDPENLHALHDLALALEATGRGEEAGARWTRLRGASGAGGALRTLAAARLAHVHHEAGDLQPADHWYSSVGSWDAGVTTALARLHSDNGDPATAKHYYQDVEAAWPGDTEVLAWLGEEARGVDPAAAADYFARAARLQPNNPQWGLMVGGCLRAAGRYQDALVLYKKLNRKFPDNIQCLKLIVKLCGDQGLPETTAWGRELQRAHARAKQQERAAMPSAGSGSSRASHSPPQDGVVGSGGATRGDSGLASSGRSQLSTASSGLPTPGPYGRSTPAPGEGRRSAEAPRPASRALRRNPSARIDEDELPLPPE